MHKQRTTGIILFGDSVFVGVGASRRSNTCGQILKSLLNVPILIKAKSEITTKDALERLKIYPFSKSIHSHVVILFGNNDCRLIDIDTPKVNLEEYKANLSRIVQKMKSEGKIPSISNLQPLDEKKAMNSLAKIRENMVKIASPYNWQKLYSNACEEVAHYHKIDLIDIRKELDIRKETVIAEDGLHPNDLGHRFIANAIIKELRINYAQ